MKKTALMIIDVQKGFDSPFWGERNNPDAESNIARLLAEWRKSDLPVIHVRHNSEDPSSPLRSGSSGNAFKQEVQPLPGENEFCKSVNSAFIGTGLAEHLRRQQISNLNVVGLTTDHCVSTSVRMAANMGFNVTLISDATATFDREGPDGAHYTANEIHNVSLVSLNREFCNVRTTEEILKVPDYFILNK